MFTVQGPLGCSSAPGNCIRSLTILTAHSPVHSPRVLLRPGSRHIRTLKTHSETTIHDPGEQPTTHIRSQSPPKRVSCNLCVWPKTVLYQCRHCIPPSTRTIPIAKEDCGRLNKRKNDDDDDDARTLPTMTGVNPTHGCRSPSVPATQTNSSITVQKANTMPKRMGTHQSTYVPNDGLPLQSNK